MALFKPKELRKYRYSVKECIVINGGKSTSLRSDNITGIEIVNNYLTNAFPIFKINLQVKNDIYYDIMKNKNTVQIKLRIQKYYKRSGKKKEKSIKKDWLNDTFVLIMDENDTNRQDDIQQKSKKNENKKKKPDSDKTKDDRNSLELYLYRKETATSMKTTPNIIFKKTNLTSAVAYLLGLAGVSNMIMSPFENNKDITQLYLPPMSVNKLIMYLDIMYGFYKAGAVVFFGLQYSYILNFKGGCTAYPSGDKKETCLLVPKKSSIEGNESGSVEKGDDKFYLNWEYDQIQFGNESVTSDVINGTNATIINPTDGSIETAESTTITNGSSNTTSIENSTDNEWLGSIHTAQTSAGSVVLRGALADVDVSAFEPYRLFSMIFEDSKLTNKYKGTYFLSECSFRFENDSGAGDFKVSVGIVLKKLEATKSTKKTM